MCGYRDLQELTEDQQTALKNVVAQLKETFGENFIEFMYNDGAFAVDLSLSDGNYSGEIWPGGVIK